MSGLPEDVLRDLRRVAGRRLAEAVEEAMARDAQRAERQQELHDWLHGRIDRLPNHDDLDRNVWGIWGIDPDRPWAEQDADED